ncbi:MAG: hypothetical protein IKI15_03690 [Lachnospiraceae bacterium]|nr:hypothetical protein [Lachnospiraceae bacterium]
MIDKDVLCDAMSQLDEEMLADTAIERTALFCESNVNEKKTMAMSKKGSAKRLLSIRCRWVIMAAIVLGMILVGEAVSVLVERNPSAQQPEQTILYIGRKGEQEAGNKCSIVSESVDNIRIINVSTGEKVVIEGTGPIKQLREKLEPVFRKTGGTIDAFEGFSYAVFCYCGQEEKSLLLVASNAVIVKIQSADEQEIIQFLSEDPIPAYGYIEELFTEKRLGK